MTSSHFQESISKSFQLHLPTIRQTSRNRKTPSHYYRSKSRDTSQLRTSNRFSNYNDKNTPRIDLPRLRLGRSLGLKLGLNPDLDKTKSSTQKITTYQHSQTIKRPNQQTQRESRSKSKSMSKSKSRSNSKSKSISKSKSRSSYVAGSLHRKRVRRTKENPCQNPLVEECREVLGRSGTSDIEINNEDKDKNTSSNKAVPKSGETILLELEGGNSPKSLIEECKDDLDGRGTCDMEINTEDKDKNTSASKAVVTTEETTLLEREGGKSPESLIEECKDDLDGRGTCDDMDMNTEDKDKNTSANKAVVTTGETTPSKREGEKSPKIPENITTEAMASVTFDIDVIDPDGNQAEEVQHDESDEYDFDADYPNTETYDLTTFDFERLTKPDKPQLTVNQTYYKRQCRYCNVLPNAFILRQLPTTSLLLRSQQLGTQRIKALCMALQENYTIQELEISEDVIDCQAMTYLIEAFKDNIVVERLFLQDDRMGRQPVKILIEYLVNVDRLSSLNLSGNDLFDTDAEILAPYIANSALLLNLDLSHNRFRDEAPEILGKALIKNSSLVNLSLSWNHIREDGMRRFLTHMIKNKGVENLDLSWNGFNLASTRVLGLFLKKNDTILTLDISACQINSQQLIELAASLTKTKNLRSIAIGTNVFSDKDVAISLQQLVQAKGTLSLREIDLVDTVISMGTYSIIQELLNKKDIVVYHGHVLGMDIRKVTDGDELASMNPVTVLIEFGRLMGMRIKELFDFMDKDGDKVLTRAEIKAGLQEFEIPLPERSLDVLIRRMDIDGDGEISINELIASGQVNTRMRIKDQMMARETKTSVKNTETARCRKILARMIHDHQQLKLEKIRKARKLEKEARASKRRKSFSKRSSSASPSTLEMELAQSQGNTSESEIDVRYPGSSVSIADLKSFTDIAMSQTFLKMTTPSLSVSDAHQSNGSSF